MEMELPFPPTKSSACENNSQWHCFREEMWLLHFELPFSIRCYRGRHLRGIRTQSYFIFLKDPLILHCHFLLFIHKHNCLQEKGVWQKNYHVTLLYHYTMYCLHTKYCSWHTPALNLSDKLTWRHLMFIMICTFFWGGVGEVLKI